jgi:N-acetylneuraminic acid mutarotase
MWGTERRGVATAVVPNAVGQSVLYAVGGQTVTGAPLSRVMAYNAATNSWTLRAPLPVPLMATNGTGVIGGKIYVSGGLRTPDKGYSDGLYVYDPVADTWATKRYMPTFGLNGVTAAIDGRLYVVTSCQDSDWCSAPNKWLLRTTAVATPRRSVPHMSPRVSQVFGAAASSGVAAGITPSGTGSVGIRASSRQPTRLKSRAGARTPATLHRRPQRDGEAQT